MSDFSPPDLAGDVVGRPETARLTPDRIEQLLADFRAWLAETDESAEPEVGLPELAAALTGLRHDVQLQTKSARALAEQTAAAVRLLERGEPAQTDDPLRPAVKALLDARDALALARREMERLSAGGPETEPLPPPAPLPPPKRGWFGPIDDSELRSAIERERRELEAWRSRQGPRSEPKLKALLSGYAMSLQRLDRMLHEWRVEPIATVGEPFDPEAMEAVEAVSRPGREPGTVVEEIRPGYRWRGRVVRCALVKVAV